MTRSSTCLRRILCGVLTLLLTNCAQFTSPRAPAPKITHIVIIIQENRSFDNLFNGFPGADSVRQGRIHTGALVRLQPISLAADFDIEHRYRDFWLSYDHGKMDGFDLPNAGRHPGGEGARPAMNLPQYAFAPQA